DILCTSRNAVQVVNSVPADKTVLFLPDRNLGNYVQRQTGRRNFNVWQGSCVVHATFPARRLTEAKMEHPRAKVVAHPECPPNVLDRRISSAPRQRSSIGACAATRRNSSS